MLDFGFHLMDCMAGMKEFPDGYFQLAICDPPYGININMNMGRRKNERKKHAEKEWDSATPDESYFQELFRVSQNQIIWGGAITSICPPPAHGYSGTRTYPMVYRSRTESWRGHRLAARCEKCVGSIAGSGDVMKIAFILPKNLSAYTGISSLTTPTPATRSSTPTSAAGQA